MTFKRPFRTTPIRMGKVYRQRHQRAQRSHAVKSAVIFGIVSLTAFAAGMAYTNPGMFPSRAEAEEPTPSAGRGYTNSGSLPQGAQSPGGVVAASTGCTWLSVHDGDTIRCGRERVRLADIDAPELPDSPKCKDGRRSYAWCDFDAGYRSRDALKSFLSSGTIEVDRQGEDKYGRTLAIVRINGQSAGDYLVSLRLAKPWR